MANAALGVTNLADATTSVVSVSASIALAGASKLLTPHVGEKWQVNATSGYVQIDLGSSMSIDSVMLAGVTGAVPLFRVRGSVANSDMSVTAFDTGAGMISGSPYFDPNHRLFVYLRAAVSVRYIRIDISEAAVASIAAGRVGVFLRDAFSLNFQTPWTRAGVRGSVDTLGVGGQTFVDKRTGYWRQNASFGFLSLADRNGFLETLAAAVVNEGHRDILWIPDPDSTNLSRDCLWGYVEGDIALTQDQYCVPPVFSVELQIRQRR